jgi:hypothetical protein
MAKREIEHLVIIPGETGGHVVEHQYKSSGNEKGPMRYEEPEKYIFGPGDDYKLTAHISKTLGLKDAKEEAEEAKLSPKAAAAIRVKAGKSMK